jgi:hypothetical protein
MNNSPFASVLRCLSKTHCTIHREEFQIWSIDMSYCRRRYCSSGEPSLCSFGRWILTASRPFEVETSLMGEAAYEFCSSDGVCRLVRPSSDKGRPGIQLFTSHSWGRGSLLCEMRLTHPPSYCYMEINEQALNSIRILERRSAKWKHSWFSITFQPNVRLASWNRPRLDPPIQLPAYSLAAFFVSPQSKSYLGRLVLRFLCHTHN